MSSHWFPADKPVGIETSFLTLALLLAIPLDHRFFGDVRGVLSVSVAEILAYLALAAGVLAWLSSDRSTRRSLAARIIHSNPAAYLYAGWVASVALLCLALGRGLEGVHATKDLIPGLVLFTLLCVSTRSRVDEHRFHSALLVATGTSSLVALSQYCLGGPYYNPINENAFFKHTWDSINLIKNPVVGPFAHPNGLALFLVPSAILLWGRALDMRERALPAREVALTFTTSALAAISVLLAQAKLAALIVLLGLAGRTALHLARSSYSPARGRVFMCALLVGGAVIVATGSFAANAMGARVELGTLMERGLLAARALEVFQNEPLVALIGGGTDAYQSEPVMLLTVHNEFLNQGLHYGLGGPLLLAAAMIVAFRMRCDRGWTYGTALACMVAVLMVEPADGSQAQGAILIPLGFAAFHSDRLLQTS